MRFSFNNQWDDDEEDSSSTVGPIWAKDRFGISQVDIRNLIHLNDSDSLPFKDIAMVIRKWAEE